MTRSQESQTLSTNELLALQGLAYVNMDLAETEKKSREKIQVEKENPQFEYYGDLDPDHLRTQLIPYLENLGDNSPEIINDICNVVHRAAQKLATEVEMPDSWTMIIVRATLPTHAFDRPRWHQDGKYFESETKTYKLVFKIKGAPTRFGEKTDPNKYEQLMSQMYNASDDPDEELRIRKELEEVVEEIEPCSDDEAAIFLVGDDDARVHSEPVLDHPRLFMSALVGSKEQIDEMKKNWDEYRARNLEANDAEKNV